MAPVRTSPWPPPTGSPVGTSGWYPASDGRWYRTDTAPAPGWALGPDGRWQEAPDEAWRWARWGLGDAWWGALVYVGASLLLGFGAIAVVALRDGDIDDLDFGPYAVSLLVIGNVVAFAGVPWWASRRKGLASLRADFGLRVRPIDLAIGVGFGLGGLIAAAVAGTAIDAAFGVDESSNIPVDSLDGPGEFLVFFVAVAIVTPIIEELFFRGLVFRGFLKRGTSTVGSVAWTTAIFVIPHLSAAEDVPSLVSLGASICVLGLAFQLAGNVTGRRLGAPIVAHVVVNGVAVVALAFA